jgi:hypothetical protein
MIPMEFRARREHPPFTQDQKAWIKAQTLPIPRRLSDTLLMALDADEKIMLPFVRCMIGATAYNGFLENAMVNLPFGQAYWAHLLTKQK